MVNIAVIGGGPAGSTVATLLAQRGFEVQLYEAARFPRPHIGESLLPATIEALSLSGAAEKVRAADFTVKHGATMAWGVDQALWTWYFRETNTTQPHAYQVNRDEFDHILLHHAASCGVKVCEDTRVTKVRFENDRATGIELEGKFRPADYVVDASGQRSLIASQLQIKRWDKAFRNLAVYRYYRGGKHLEGDDAGNILVESIHAGWLWKIPLKDCISSVGVVADRDEAVAALRKRSMTEWFGEIIQSSRYASKLLADAESVGPCEATRDWSYQASRFAGTRHCLIGDAACFIDPLFSTGVHLAIYSATMAAALIATTLHRPALAAMAAIAFERQFRQHYEHFRELARLFYGANRSLDSYFWESRRITGESEYEPRAAFVRALSGQVARGYERSTLAHAELPASFTRALHEWEFKRQQNQLDFDRVSSDTLLSVKGNLQVVDSAIFTGDAFELGQVIRRKQLDDIPIAPFVAETINMLQSKPHTSAMVNEKLLRRGWSRDVLTTSLLPTLRLLFTEGIVRKATV